MEILEVKAAATKDTRNQKPKNVVEYIPKKKFGFLKVRSPIRLNLSWKSFYNEHERTKVVIDSSWNQLEGGVICKLGAGFEYFLSNVSGEVDKGNFVYYSMAYDGTILLELTSMSGDCDLYVSQNTKKPSYEPQSNCLSSSSCGVDSIIIPKSFKRPVGIGIFGHPSHDICSFNLIFYRIDDSRDIFNFDPYADTLQKDIDNQIHTQTTSKEEEESLFWVFLRSLVVFLIEIIL